MYSVLIVDDEKMVRDCVYGILSMVEDMELSLAVASSAIEARSIFERQKIDIAVMDINMPQMSGLELYDIIREKWPFCKVIFLTGYSEFDYVYRVQKHARYLLKAEDNEKIVDAVRESIADIENDFVLEQKDANERDRILLKRYESMAFMRDLVDGIVKVRDETGDILRNMDVELELRQPVYYAMMHLDDMNSGSYYGAQEQLDSIFLLIEKYYMNLMHGVAFQYNRNIIFCILQPRKLSREEHVIKMLEGNSDLFQKAVKRNVNVPVTIFIGSESIPFPQAIASFNEINDRMAWMEKEELLVGELYRHGGEKENEEVLADSEKQELLVMMQRLDYLFSIFHEEAILSCLENIRDKVQKVSSMHDLFVLELYCQISTRLLGSIKRLGINRELAFQTGLIDLYNVSSHTDWRSSFQYLLRVTESMFFLKKQNLDKIHEDVAMKVKQYIGEHLSGDTSLDTLATHCSLSQEHMLRVFKRQEGVTILQYINTLKINKAKEMLLDSDMQVKEIAMNLGFSAPGYFTRFFKAKMGMTPNAFRERQGSDG